MGPAQTRALRDPGGKHRKCPEGMTWSCQDYGQYLTSQERMLMARKSNKQGRLNAHKMLHKPGLSENGYQSAAINKLHNVAKESTDYET